MCGILGLHMAHTPKMDMLAAVNLIRHRGPDACQIWEKKEVTLAHARLSIIDLSERGQQPFHNKDNTIHLIANGEIYDHLQLRRELQQMGYTFYSQSDSEVLLHGYEHWGIEGLLARINGMFAFAIWDEKKDCLFLARDRLGIKPLYYFYKEGHLAFASELPALKPLLPAAPHIDEKARDCYFFFGYLPGELSIYQHCYKLLAGHYLKLQHGKLTQKNYWKCPLPTTKKHTSFSINTIEEKIIAAVHRRLVSDRPLGMFLSGGIDSSLVVAIARQHLAQVKTFSVQFPFHPCDESRYAAKIAKYLETDHTTLSCTQKEAQEMIVELPSMFGEPFSDASAISTALLCKLTRQKVTVALSGDGGDELCLGYNHYLKSGKIQALMYLPGRKMLGYLLSHFFSSHSFTEKLANFLQIKDRAQACAVANSRFHSFLFTRLLQRSFAVENTFWHKLFQKTKHLPLLTSWAWADLQHFMVESVLAKIDRSSMKVALEVRVPLLDHHVVESFMALPTSAKMQNGESKWILKKILQKYIPLHLWQRPKQGFSPPIGQWLRGELNEMLRDYLSPSRLRPQGIFDVDYVQKLILDHEQGRQDNQYYLWTLLMWELWREYHMVSS